MLNYLWAGLVLASIFWAIGSDVLRLADPPAVPRQALVYGDDGNATLTLADGTQVPLPAVLSADERQLTIDADTPLPEPLAEARAHLDPDGGPLVLEIDDAGFVASPAVRWANISRVTRAAFDMAEVAVTISLGLIGLLALWLGLLKIGEAAGLVAALVGLVRPILRPLFPSLPHDSPAFAMIALNVTANVLGLGNAATPLGLKAMEELQKLNPTDDTATDPMVMLLAVNTASVTLVPPATLVAVMGFEAGQLTLPIIVTTSMSLIVAIAAVKLYGLIPAVRRSNPDLVSKELA